VAHRTKEKNGYVALQLGSGFAKDQERAKAERGHFAVAKVEPKRKLAEFRVARDAADPGRRRNQADHFVVGQFVDVTGVSSARALPAA
jgi:large subunit ribosomal protein L3